MGIVSNELGAAAENLAVEYLVSNGYSICGRNVRVGHKEIDIIAEKGTMIVFIEVKARSGKDGDPLDAVDSNKIKRIVRAADVYMRSQKFDRDCRFDIITFTGDLTNYRMEHIEDAFIPPLANGIRR